MRLHYICANLIKVKSRVKIQFLDHSKRKHVIYNNNVAKSIIEVPLAQWLAHAAYTFIDCGSKIQSNDELRGRQFDPGKEHHFCIFYLIFIFLFSYM